MALCRSLFICANLALTLAGAQAWAQTPGPVRPDGLLPDDRLYSIMVMVGRSVDDQSFSDSLMHPGDGNGSDTFVGAAISRRLARFWRYFVVDAEAGGGYRAGGTDGGEAWAALYVRFDGFPWERHLYTSLGASTGINWVSRLPPPERVGTEQSQWLHYFSPEIAFALPDRRENELVIRYHHRSGIFGAIGGVWDGSNVITAGFRRRF